MASIVAMRRAVTLVASRRAQLLRTAPRMSLLRSSREMSTSSSLSERIRNAAMAEDKDDLDMAVLEKLAVEELASVPETTAEPVEIPESYGVEDMLFDFGKSFAKMVPCESVMVSHGQLTIQVEPQLLLQALRVARNHSHCQYKILSCITGVDYPQREQRFEIIYDLLSTDLNSRMRLKTYADEVTPVDSACSVYENANWWEREIYDMFGVFFLNHPDLRRILTDYGFEGHPLRKDFPLSGYTEVRYDEEEKRVVNEPLELAQGFRQFDYSSPWAFSPEQLGENIHKEVEIDMGKDGVKKQ